MELTAPTAAEAVPGAESFLAGFGGGIVPDCEIEAMRSVLACASAGYAGPRRRDGQKASWLTPSGIPFEASVSGGGSRAERVLRYATEPATGLPFFVPKLAAQRTVTMLMAR